MKRLVRNMLPEDSRIGEIGSAVALILLAAFLPSGAVVSAALEGVQPVEFWTVAVGAIGFLQLWSVAIYPQAEILRGITALVTGGFWIWAALSGSGHGSRLEIVDFLGITVGIGNLWGFITVAATARREWNS